MWCRVVDRVTTLVEFTCRYLLSLKAQLYHCVWFGDDVSFLYHVNVLVPKFSVVFVVLVASFFFVFFVMGVTLCLKN